MPGVFGTIDKDEGDVKSRLPRGAQHGKALAMIGTAHKLVESIPEVDLFEPYCLRHTALTWLAESGSDAFTLARIAGHGSITITQRYCHPQAEAIESAFLKMSEGHGVYQCGLPTETCQVGIQRIKWNYSR